MVKMGGWLSLRSSLSVTERSSPMPVSTAESELDDLIASVVSKFASDSRVDHVRENPGRMSRLPSLVATLQHHGFALGGPGTVVAGEADVLISAAAGREQAWLRWNER
ncbi:hypothetical protein QJS66_07190 [Kocuria rhizophila]|nr:hypothetical protein QJS66_07190 [Kocuria rhizophila]